MSMSMSEEWLDRDTDPWLDRARALKNRIRDRFRVAVDRRRHRLKESDYNLAIRRWPHRIRSFLHDRDRIVSTRYSSSASLRFYHRKKVDKDVDSFDNDSMFVRLLQSVAVPVIGNACHVFMHGLNYVQVYGVEKLHKALLQRPEGKALITVCG